MQLPAWNEALGLPRPWDQQWGLRIQQVLAFESDLLEYGDLFEGSEVVETKTAQLQAAAEAEIAKVLGMGGVIPAVESGYLKAQLVASHATRRARIESGEAKVVGVNCFQASEPNPLTADLHAAIQHVDPASERAVLADLARWRGQRDEAEVAATLAQLKADAAQERVNLMPATLACARAGVTTGEWSFALREVFGEYRAPTGVGGTPVAVSAEPGGELAAVREAVAATAGELGVGRLRLLIGKPGLDGHSNGAEQIAVRARDAGFEVIYQGIRLTPEQIVAAAVAEDVHCIGLSVLSGAHGELVPAVLRGLRRAGAADLPVVAGGIIPPEDAESLRAQGVAAVFTPADFGITTIIGRIVGEIRRAHDLKPLQSPAAQPRRDDLVVGTGRSVERPGSRWVRRNGSACLRGAGSGLLRATMTAPRGGCLGVVVDDRAKDDSPYRPQMAGKEPAPGRRVAIRHHRNLQGWNDPI